MKLEYKFYIGTGPEEVWDVLVNPEKSFHAFMGGVIRSSMQVGDPIEFVGPGVEGDQTVHIYGRLLAFEEYKLLSYTDHPGPSHHDRHSELESTVTLRLDTVGGCTLLHLVNDQWTDNNPQFEKADQFWWMILSNIKTIAETGKPLDFGYEV